MFPDKKLIKVAVTGPRPEKMDGIPESFIRSDIRDKLEILLEEYDGKVQAYSGMARGVDTIFAKQALRMGIPLFSIIPFSGFDSKWNYENKKTLHMLLNKACETITVCAEPSKAAYQRRNEFLVQNSDLLLAYYISSQKGGTANCMSYASTQPIEIWDIDITELFAQLKS